MAGGQRAPTGYGSSACAASGWWWAASAPLARSLAGCAGGQSVATPLLALLHFVARRRLPAVKRTAALAGVSACKVNTVPPAHCASIRRLRGKPSRVPSSFLLHSAGRTRPRQTRCAGLPVKRQTSWRFAFVGLNPSGCSLRSIVTQPGRGKSQAIEHNRALPKVGQSLRRLRLVAYRCAPFGFG